MATNPQARVLELLRRFNDGQKICIDALKHDAIREGESEKNYKKRSRCYKRVFSREF